MATKAAAAAANRKTAVRAAKPTASPARCDAAQEMMPADKRNAQTAGRKPKYQADDRVDTGSVQDSNFDQCPQGQGLN